MLARSLARRALRAPFTPVAAAPSCQPQLQQEEECWSAAVHGREWHSNTLDTHAPPLANKRHHAPSPWALQFSSHLTSGSSAAAVPQATSYNAVSSEAVLVEEWLSELAHLRPEERDVCTGLLSRNPGLLWAESPSRITSTVAVLAESLREKGFMRPWFFSDKLVLQLVERYSPDALRSRLSQLHSDVWARLDDEGALTAMLLAARRASTRLDLLDLDARALAARAHKLHGLVPHFAPSTLLRAAPELQDVEPEEVHRAVQRAGQVVVVAAAATAARLELRAQPDDTIHVVRLLAPSHHAGPAPASAAASAAAGVVGYSHFYPCGSPSTVTRRFGVRSGSSFDDPSSAAFASPPSSPAIGLWGTRGAAAAADASAREEEPGEVIARLPNTRMVVFVDPAFAVDVRFEAAPAAAAAAAEDEEEAGAASPLGLSVA